MLLPRSFPTRNSFSLLQNGKNSIRKRTSAEERPFYCKANANRIFYMIIHTRPPLLSFTIFCMVSWSFTWLSSLIMASLFLIPSSTSCWMDFPKMLVSQMLSPRSGLSLIYFIRSSACCSVPTMGAISVSIPARII